MLLYPCLNKIYISVVLLLATDLNNDRMRVFFVLVHDILMRGLEVALVASQGESVVDNLDVSVQICLVAANKLAKVTRPSK